MADDGPVRDSKRARVGDAKGDSASAVLELSAGSCSDDNGSVASSTLMTAEDEFGSTADLLGEPVMARNPTAAAIELEKDVKESPHAVREKLLSLAKGLTGSRGCTNPMGKWTKQRPHETPTCGLRQADLVAGVDMEAIFKRQQEREALGDNVPYVLARMIRSSIQYEASIVIGAKGIGSQADRGACMKQAMSMFCGVGMEGIPRDVDFWLWQGPR